jgi:hypothetical protein
MPVGPRDRDVERARDAVESLLAYEPEVGTIVLVDDGPEARDLVAEVVPEYARARALSAHNPRDGRGEAIYGGTCAATATGLRVLHEEGNAPMVLRMDNDALVIAPFAAKVAAALEREPQIGVAGSYDFAPTRMPRDFTAWEPTLRKLTRPVWIYKRPPQGASRVHVALSGRAGRVRAELRAALANGYRFGEHCLAAACVLTRDFVDRAAASGYLDDPLDWIDTWCPDDVMLGVQARAVGLSLHGMTEPGDPFGLAQRRLPGPPEWLVEQGHSIIHAVKDEADVDEAAVRAWFRERRPSAG